MTEPLDMSQDPDRFDAGRAEPSGPLDRSQDPDRFVPQPGASTLPEMLGEGAHEQERDGYEWLLGLVVVFGFLLLVTIAVHVFGQ